MSDPSPMALRKLLELRQFPVFAGADLGELATVVDNLVEVVFPAGVTVAAPPARLPALHLIVDGRIELRPPGRAIGAPGRVTAWHRRQAFGTLEVLAGRSVAATAFAAVDTRTLRLSASDVGELLEDNFGLMGATLRDLAGRIAALGLTGAAPAGPPPPPGTDPLGLVDRLIVLRSQLPFLSSRIEPLAILAHAAHEVTWPAGATLATAGELAHDAIVVLAGAVCAARDGGPVEVHGPGHVIGVLETLGRLRHPASLTAVTPTRGLLVPSRAIFDVLEDHTELGRGLVATFAGLLLDASRSLESGAMPALALAHDLAGN